MKIIIRKATILDAESPFNNQKLDVLILDGKIHQIASNIDNSDNCQEISAQDLHISQGWFDSSVSLGEPGFEDRENIDNGLFVAAKSGFTGIALQPNTFPILDNQSQIYFVKSKAQNHLTELFPIGALTKNSEGKDLAELFDMKNAGAVAFGDYNKSLENANLLKIGLQYLKDFDGLLIAFCQDQNLKGNGVVNEGVESTRLGLKGIPNLAEALHVQRNLALLEYTGGKLHIPTISTPEAVNLIKEAKNKGLNVTCSVAVHHLVLNDQVLEDFDTRYKIMPPLRSENDRKALVNAVLDGTIDAITTDHNPLDIELKKMEFDSAKFGTIGLESAFGTLQTILPTQLIIEKLTAARTIFGQKTSPILEGNNANITVFSTSEKGTFQQQNILSKSKNSAFLGQNTLGKVIATINNNKVIS